MWKFCIDYVCVVSNMKNIKHFNMYKVKSREHLLMLRGVRDPMVVGFTMTYTISVCHH